VQQHGVPILRALNNPTIDRLGGGGSLGRGTVRDSLNSRPVHSVEV
jgi:hypothetical protein